MELWLRDQILDFLETRKTSIDIATREINDLSSPFAHVMMKHEITTHNEKIGKEILIKDLLNHKYGYLYCPVCQDISFEKILKKIEEKGMPLISKDWEK